MQFLPMTPLPLLSCNFATNHSLQQAWYTQGQQHNTLSCFLKWVWSEACHCGAVVGGKFGSDPDRARLMYWPTKLIAYQQVNAYSSQEIAVW